jgi:AmiR/NasT family two-component response regulator
MDKHPEWDNATIDQLQKLTDKVEGLEEALLSRDVIGQAKGILMERLHLTSDQAFEELRSSSQKHNRKVRDIAAELAATGEWPLIVSTNGNGSANGNGNGLTG